MALHLPPTLAPSFRPPNPQSICCNPLASSDQNPRSSSSSTLPSILLSSIMAESSSASYIRMVQHLIEQCLLFRMNKDECMDALAKHANIMPVISSTVWNELEKENKEFFQAYMKDQEDKASEMEAAQKIQKMLAEFALKDSDKED